MELPIIFFLISEGKISEEEEKKKGGIDEVIPLEFYFELEISFFAFLGSETWAEFELNLFYNYFFFSDYINIKLLKLLHYT